MKRAGLTRRIALFDVGLVPAVVTLWPNFPLILLGFAPIEGDDG